MAAAEGTVLFHRGNEEDGDSDVWDDSALIEAYDAAVAPIKAKLAARTGDPSILESKKKTADYGQSKKKNKKKKSKHEKKNQQLQSRGWAVGDNCQAVYTEDGTVYEAKIISINSKDGTCVVRYLGYGNEEEQSLEDLIRSEKSAHRQRRDDYVSLSETDSVSSVSQKAGKKGQASSTRSWGAPAFPNFGQGGNFFHPSPPPPPPSYFPGMPNHPPFNMSHSPMASASSTTMPFPMMPPPPPMPNDSVTNENEALCSMLLSWYMSGYHTGYYQGLKQSQQQDASAAMGPAR